MSTPLSELLTEAQAGDWLYEQVALLMLQDKMPANTAWINVGQRVLAGDPLLLAAPGQHWTLRREFAELAGPWDATRIVIRERLTCPPQITVTDNTGADRTLPISALSMFELAQWRWNQ